MRAAETNQQHDPVSPKTSCEVLFIVESSVRAVPEQHTPLETVLFNTYMAASWNTESVPSGAG